MLSRRILRRFCTDYNALAAKMVAEAQELTNGLGEERVAKIKESLTPHQLKRIEKLATITADLPKNELMYLVTKIEKYANEEKHIPLLSLYTDWTSIKPLEDGSYPVANPNWFLQQEALAKLFPGGYDQFAELFAGAVGGGGGGRKVSNESSGQSVKEEVKEVEEPKEQTAFTVKIVGFEASSKIKIIKEIRSMLNLGLKDVNLNLMKAKDFVEKLPAIVKADIKKEDAEALQEKLTPLGCTIEIS